jgi:hydrogenase nickel incorporation protein HypB
MRGNEFMSRIIRAEEGEIFDIELAEDLLKANAILAQKNKQVFKNYGIKAIDVMGSVGTGKTSLIEQIVHTLKDNYRIAVIAGDLTTTIDADRIAKYGAEVIQINTGKECHLDANLVKKALRKIDLTTIDVLFIENVGNLICPAEFPLGSEKRIVVISLTEGPFMVIKHPFIFMETDVVVINKMDLVDVLDIDVTKLVQDITQVNPQAKIVKVSCKTGMGIQDLLTVLKL